MHSSIRVGRILVSVGFHDRTVCIHASRGLRVTDIWLGLNGLKIRRDCQ